MPVANYATYCKMLDRAHAKGFAYPAINVTSMVTANAVLEGLAAAKSDGIIQVSTGGGSFASGLGIKDMAVGATSIAEHIHRVAEHYPINVALHTDHCQEKDLESFVLPLIAETEKRRSEGRPNLFNSHMFDGSALPVPRNLEIARGLLERCHAAEIILEVEIGVVGGEEDGVSGGEAGSAKLYTTTEDMLAVAEQLNPVGGRYMLAATFGNVHGVYKPGNVKLTPSILKDGQDAVEKAHGKDARFFFVFHGGSGSSPAEIKETIGYGVVKMNVDTDTQYAFTRPIVDHMMSNYAGVLKIDGEVGNKKKYDPRSYMKLAEAAMSARVQQAAADLNSVGTTMLG